MYRHCFAIGVCLKDLRKNSGNTAFAFPFLNKETPTDAFYISLQALENLQYFPRWKTPQIFPWKRGSHQASLNVSATIDSVHFLLPGRAGRQRKRPRALRGLAQAARPRCRTWTSQCPRQYPCHARRPRIPGPGRAAPTERR